MRNVKFNNKRVFLILWGVLCAFIFVQPHLFSLGQGWVAEWRGQRLVDRYELLLEYGEFDFSMVTHTIGYPLYFPYLMRLMNITDGLQMYYFVQAFTGAVIVSLYPYLLYEITHSWSVALISPIILHFSIGDMLYISKSGEYFSSLWVLVIGIPLLFLLNKIQEQNGKFYWIISELAVVIMMSNIMRSHSGLPLFPAAVVRIISNIFDVDKDSSIENKQGNPLMNSILYRIFFLEGVFLEKGVHFPAGVSLIAKVYS